MPPAAIFDLDGTLLDTLLDLKNSVNQALAENGFPERTTEEVRQFVGNGIARLVHRALGAEQPPEVFEKVLADTKRIYNARCREHTAPYPGITAMLEQLRKDGIRVAVVSNKPDPQVKKLCEEFFGEAVQSSVGQRQGIPLKPSPESLLAAVQTLGTCTENAVYIGDSDVDVLTAKRGNMPCISVLWGFRDRNVMEAAGGQYFAEDAEGLYKLILKLLRR